MKRILATLAMSIALIFGGLTVSTTAQAATPNGGAWVIAPKWWGWCPNDTILQVNVINYTAGTMNFSGTRGFDKVHIAVVQGRTNQIQVSVLCKWTSWQSSGSYNYLAVTANEQTFFTGADGSTWRQ